MYFNYEELDETFVTGGAFIADECGDTFIDASTDSPFEQWANILAMLDEAGYEIAVK